MVPLRVCSNVSLFECLTSKTVAAMMLTQVDQPLAGLAFWTSRLQNFFMNPGFASIPFWLFSFSHLHIGGSLVMSGSAKAGVFSRASLISLKVKVLYIPGVHSTGIFHLPPMA